MSKAPAYTFEANPAEPPPPYASTDPGTPSPSPQPQPYAQHQVGSSSSSSAVVARQFPPTFSVYSGFMTSDLTIGQHKDSPIYAVSVHSGLSGQPNLVLHAGTTKRAPLMAAVDFHSFSRRMDITLPPPSSSSPAAKNSSASGGAGIRNTGPRAHETVEARFSGWNNAHPFTIDVEATGRREAFEWRHSTGGLAVGSLDAGSSGWKLVRMDAGTDRNANGGFTTSDGRPVVAVWSRTNFRGNKVGKFMFLGAGADGSLGERWAMMAVMSALGLYEKQRRQERRSAAAA